MEKYRGMKILDVYWFSTHINLSQIGIVVTKNEVGEIKARIGTGTAGSRNEEGDIHMIIDNGGKISLGSLKKLVEQLSG